MFVPLILIVVSLFIFRKPLANAIRRARSEGSDVPAFEWIGHKIVWLCILAAVGMLLFVSANLFRPHFVDAMMVYGFGHFADAKVVNTKMFSDVNDPEITVRYEVMYKTAAGELVETYFHSSDHNFYPPAGSISQARPGETFRIAYLPNFPSVFVVLTEAESPCKTRAQCAELGLELNKAIARRDFEPDSAQFAQELAAAAKRYADAGCN